MKTETIVLYRSTRHLIRVLKAISIKLVPYYELPNSSVDITGSRMSPTSTRALKIFISFTCTVAILYHWQTITNYYCACSDQSVHCFIVIIWLLLHTLLYIIIYTSSDYYMCILLTCVFIWFKIRHSYNISQKKLVQADWSWMI